MIFTLPGWLFPRFMRDMLPAERKRLELRKVEWDLAHDLILCGWTIAHEEDTNHEFGWVYLERLEEAK